MNNSDLIKIGQVQSVDAATNMIKVLHADTDGLVSRSLPIMRPKPLPEVGDTVLVVYLSNGNSYGICIGGYYQSANAPDENIIECLLLPDGACIKYNTVTKILTIDAEHVVINGTEVGI